MKMLHTGRFVTGVSQVKKVPAGEPVGYGCKDPADHNRTIAIVPVGYADGMRRILGNGKGRVFISGNRAPLIGNICMDMCMADITGLKVKTGDEVEIFGENITIEEMAGWCDTIPYEILTSIPQRVKRIYFNE
jgi:Alr-MurF fusion protein